MSAYLCANNTLLELARALVASGLKAPSIEAVATTLQDENLRSLEARYGASHGFTVEPMPTAEAGAMLPPLTIAEVCDRYEYQACEHAGWETSITKRWIDGLRKLHDTRPPEHPRWGRRGQDGLTLVYPGGHLVELFGVRTDSLLDDEGLPVHPSNIYLFPGAGPQPTADSTGEASPLTPGATRTECAGGWETSGAKHYADVIPGESIRLHGIETNSTKGPYHYDRTYNLGDAAEYGSYNLHYLGTIVAIGAKTVTIDKGSGYRANARLKIGEFGWRNRDGLDNKRKANASWSD